MEGSGKVLKVAGVSKKCRTKITMKNTQNGVGRSTKTQTNPEQLSTTKNDAGGRREMQKDAERCREMRKCRIMQGLQKHSEKCSIM
jgi:hypothetical protein